MFIILSSVSFAVLDTAASAAGAHPGNPDISRFARLEREVRLEDNSQVIVAAEELVGREDEIGRLAGFVQRVPDGPRGVVVRGEAGIGKTTLWRHAVEAAAVAGLTILATRCVEAELPLGLAGLTDLVEERLPDVAEKLADPQRSALAVAAGLEAPRSAAPEGIVLPRAFVAFLRVLAGDEPVLVAVDDIQWLDPPSLKILAFAARRLRDAPVGILVTQRGDGDDPLKLADAFGGERFDDMALGGLSIGALAHLVRSRLGVRIPRPALARVHAATDGNPMFALEFARSIAERGGPPLGPLPIPPSLEQLVRDRVAAYPRALKQLLALVAVVERPTRSLLVEATGDEATALLDDALEAGAVSVGDDGVVRFTHPLLASAVYAGLPAGERRTLHTRVAAVSRDLEERARHMAIASTVPGADVARLLEESAVQARARGAPVAAAELAQQAVRLTPPSDAAARTERALAVVGYLSDADQLAAASAYLDEILARGVTGPMRARALLLRATVDDDLELLGPAADEALVHVGDDLALRARALLIMSSYQLHRNDLAASEQSAREALALAEELDDPALLATALGTVAGRADKARRPEPALLERAIAVADSHGSLPHWASPRVRLAECLVRDGVLEKARGLLEVELDIALQSGNEYRRGRIVEPLADIELGRGNWQRAEQYLDEGWELAVDGGNVAAEAFVLLRKARLAALRGHVEESRRLVSEGAARGESLHWSSFTEAGRCVLGFVALSLGDPARAWEALSEIHRALTGPRRRNQEVMPAVADALEALVALGRLEQADELLAELVDEAEAGHRWAGAAVARSRALLLLARGDAAASFHAANESADRFEGLGFQFDRARSLLVAGDALRRLGERRRAAEKLQAARAVFAELGASLWVERAERELRRARPRPRRDGELTSAERRVAALAAAGKTNREVAAQLFTTVATVEAHLTRIYRKIDVRSRTELAARVADGTLSLADD
jgi:DNA-binding CsgD family transcriptional regulator